jgi:hypothetical protein
MDEYDLDVRDKRIIREVRYIRNNHKDYKHISINYIDPNTMYLDIKTKRGNILHFDISKYHPFKPPKLEIQTKDGSYNYIYHLQSIPKSILYYLNHPNDTYIKDRTHTNYYNNKDSQCLCCKSILCGSNWSPAIRIHHIILEIEEHNKTKEIIKYKLLMNYLFKIKNIPLDLITIVIGFIV